MSGWVGGRWTWTKWTVDGDSDLLVQVTADVPIYNITLRNEQERYKNTINARRGCKYFHSKYSKPLSLKLLPS